MPLACTNASSASCFHTSRLQCCTVGTAEDTKSCVAQLSPAYEALTEYVTGKEADQAKTGAKAVGHIVAAARDRLTIENVIHKAQPAKLIPNSPA